MHTGHGLGKRIGQTGNAGQIFGWQGIGGGQKFWAEHELDDRHDGQLQFAFNKPNRANWKVNNAFR